MSNNATKYEVLIKQYLRSILDISGSDSERPRRKVAFTTSMSIRRGWQEKDSLYTKNDMHLTWKLSDNIVIGEGRTGL